VRTYRSFWGALAFAAAIGAGPAAADPDPSPACAYLAGLVDPAGGPILLESYPTTQSGPLHAAAFLYDNAATAIAMVGCGETGRARRIADAILFAMDNDRTWHDGSLRNGYVAGPMTEKPVKLLLWFDKEQKRWQEDSYQVGSDTGNMAWAMLALLALDRAEAGPQYRAGALRIATVLAVRQDQRGPGGFTGGLVGDEPSPLVAQWKSTEHNLDLAAAFTLLAAATQDPAWSDRAAASERFVEAMWNGPCGCFAVGTGEDGVTPSPNLVLDAQIGPLLALPGKATSPFAGGFATAEWRLRVRGGFTYSDAGHAIWTEGTAQVALLARLLGRTDELNELLSAVNDQRSPQGGYYATSAAALPTGFGDPTDPTHQRFYYHLPHLAPAAWAALAERGFNPYTLTTALPVRR